jgi:ribosome-associated protein
MKTSDLKNQVAVAIRACEEKKAENISILQLEKGAFTDFLLLCSGANQRQVQAIADEVELRLKQVGVFPNSVEGYKLAQWVLLDYVDYVVQIFAAERRSHYDLDRLWRHAKRLGLDDLQGRASRAPAAPAPAASVTKRKQARPRRASTLASAIRAAAAGQRTRKPTTRSAKKAGSRPRKKK